MDSFQTSMKSTKISQDSMNPNFTTKDLEPFKVEMEAHKDIGKALLQEKRKAEQEMKDIEELLELFEGELQEKDEDPDVLIIESGSNVWDYFKEQPMEDEILKARKNLKRHRSISSEPSEGNLSSEEERPKKRSKKSHIWHQEDRHKRSQKKHHGNPKEGKMVYEKLHKEDHRNKHQRRHKRGHERTEPSHDKEFKKGRSNTRLHARGNKYRSKHPCPW